MAADDREVGLARRRDGPQPTQAHHTIAASLPRQLHLSRRPADVGDGELVATGELEMATLRGAKKVPQRCFLPMGTSGGSTCMCMRMCWQADGHRDARLKDDRWSLTAQAVAGALAIWP